MLARTDIAPLDFCLWGWMKSEVYKGNHIFINTKQKYMMLLPFERGMFAVSL
jgi:hypothetical protein